MLHNTTAVQAGRWQVGFPMGSLGFFIDLITPALGSIQPLTKIITKDISWGGGKRSQCVGLTIFTIFTCRLSRDSGSFKFVDKGLSRPVMGQLYTTRHNTTQHNRKRQLHKAAK